jgi:dTDP-L-rhamnose 4-epimerase
VTASLENCTVLVTGGAGFIGCAISQRLAPLVGSYVVLDNLHPQVHSARVRPADLHESATLVVGDVTEAPAWDGLLAEHSPDVVIHLAAETGTGQSLTESTRHAHVNVVGTTQMLDAFTRFERRPSHILLSSSRAVYGEGAWQRTDGEIFYPGQRTHAQLERGQWDYSEAISLPSSVGVTTPDPTSVYGATKLAQEQILRSWAQSFSVPTTVLRLQNVYGPGQSLTNSYTGIVALFSQLARRGESIPLYEDGDVTRDFVFIDDVADAFVAAAQRPPAISRAADIGSGERSSIAQMATLLAQHYDAPLPKVNGMFRDGDVRHAHCSISSAQALLEWEPRWSLAAGLAKLQDWLPTALA